MTSHASSNRDLLDLCYSLGIVGLSMVGSPCETFSEARHTAPPIGSEERWPRPLRSRAWLYGLPDLSIREFTQVRIGSDFFFLGLRALCGHLCHGRRLVPVGTPSHCRTIPIVRRLGLLGSRSFCGGIRMSFCIISNNGDGVHQPSNRPDFWLAGYRICCPASTLDALMLPWGKTSRVNSERQL